MGYNPAFIADFNVTVQFPEFLRKFNKNIIIKDVSGAQTSIVIQEASIQYKGCPVIAARSLPGPCLCTP